MSINCRRARLLFSMLLFGLSLVWGCGDSTEPERLTNKVTMPTDIVVTAGDHFSVPIEFENEVPVAVIAMPLKYPSSIMRCDSVSFVGSRCSEFFLLRSFVAADTIQILLVDTVGIAQGQGLMATLHFWVYGNAPDANVTVDLFLSPLLDFGYGDTSLVFGVITPDFRAGRIQINSTL